MNVYRYVTKSVFRYLIYFNLTHTANKWPSESDKKRLDGIGRHQLGTIKVDSTDDI